MRMEEYVLVGTKVRKKGKPNPCGTYHRRMEMVNTWRLQWIWP